jgi:hypothetical protein
MIIIIVIISLFYIYEYVYACIDAQALFRFNGIAAVLNIGKEVTRGLGAGTYSMYLLIIFFNHYISASIICTFAIATTISTTTTTTTTITSITTTTTTTTTSITTITSISTTTTTTTAYYL